MEVDGHLHAPASLPLEKAHRYPLIMGLDGLQGRYGRYSEKKNRLSLPSIEFKTVSLHLKLWSKFKFYLYQFNLTPAL